MELKINGNFNVFAGTVRGVLVNTECKPEQNAKFDTQFSGKSMEVTEMKWGPTEDKILIGYKDGSVKLYDVLLKEYTDVTKEPEGDGPIVGAGFIGNKIIFCHSSGHVNICCGDSTDMFKMNFGDEATLISMECNENRKNVIGTGGERNDLKLWDIEAKKCIFNAKSMGHDELNLPIPTSIRGISFFSCDDKLNACATKEGQVLLYDERVQRRPIVKFVEPKASYTTISTTYKEKQCLVGTTKGYIQLIDFRNPTKCLKTFKSFSGSVTSIVCDPSSSVVASTSLDRFFRIHSIDTKELLYKEYLKQSLTKLIMKPIMKDEKDKTDTNSEIQNVHDISVDKDDEYEQIFDQMEVISEKKHQKRHIRKELHDKVHITKRKRQNV